MSDYTTEVTQDVSEALRKVNGTTLPALMKKVNVQQLLEDLSLCVQEETVVIASDGTGTLSKIPVGIVHMCKSDGSATYAQVPDAVTPSSNQWRITNRKTGAIATHSGLQGYTMKCYYLGLTKASDTSAYYSLLQELLAAAFTVA